MATDGIVADRKKRENFDKERRTEWQPDRFLPGTPKLWPISPVRIVKWLYFYVVPWNSIFMAFSVIFLLYLTPSMETMKTLNWNWIALIFARNCALLTVFVSLLHFPLYVKKSQGFERKYNGRWLARNNPNFMFKNQLLDNLFWTFFSGVPIWTTYEVFTWWAFANEYIPHISFAKHPVYCAALLIITPLFMNIHFYLIHRLIHLPLIYRWVHSVHHANVNVGPWSGLSMHPVEHILYWSGVLVYWIVPSNPVNAMYYLIQNSFSPAQAHTGFESIIIKDGVELRMEDYHHYLHHRYFECNYGGGTLVNLDAWFGTLNDGSPASMDKMNRRVISRQQRVQRESQVS
ncbi:MAG: sterol desaturase family protein [Mesorhizobium sp.]|uniref:sterol desaturase family protein n=1 Tax=Mesorhizobium sp. TaxID=1871066 RepID=UPI000FEA49B9|nr:sterol desaturase family protein [Mesorhizobium sp.]RWE19960.1 MAG: sterol desaturase family protein [Mesorhizobium sp.]